MDTLMIVLLLGTGIMDVVVQSLMYTGLALAWLWEHLDEFDLD